MDNTQNMTAPWYADSLAIASSYSDEQNRYADVLVDALELEKDSTVFQMGGGDGLLTLKLGLKLRELGGEGVLFVAEFGRKQTERLEKKVASVHLMHQVRIMPMVDIVPGELPVAVGAIDRFIAVNFFQYLEADSPYYDELERVLNPTGCALLVDWRDKNVLGYAAKDSEDRLNRMKASLEHEGLHYRERDDISETEWVLEVW